MIKMNAHNVFDVILGFRGENNVKEIIFGYEAWQKEFGDGILSLSVMRSVDNTPYSVVLEIVDDTHKKWVITDADTSYEGKGIGQLVYTVDGAIKKSSTFNFDVLHSLNAPSQTAPDPYKTWYDDLVELSAQVETDKQEAGRYADASRESSVVSENHANESLGYANDSLGYANQSKDYRNESQGYANNASDFANNASDYADDAQRYAEQAEHSVSMGGYITADLINGHLVIKYVNIDTIEFELRNGRLVVIYE